MQTIVPFPWFDGNAEDAAKDDVPVFRHVRMT